MGIEMKYVTFFVVLAAFVLVQETDAATYVVGDSLGWTIPSGGAAAYATWAAKNKYVPGDILVFNYAAGVHDVATVTKSAYDSCSSTSPLSLQTVSPTNVTLTTAGTYYFICTFGQHCSFGQKLTLTVGSASATTPSASASPPTATTPPPTATTTPPTTAITPPTAAITPPTAATKPPTAATTPIMSPTGSMPPAAAPIMPPTAATSPTPGTGAPAPVPTMPSSDTPNGAPTPTPTPAPSPGPDGDSGSPPAPSAASRKAVTMLVVAFGIVVMSAIC